MQFVRNLKDRYDELGLPEEFVDCLPEFCPECGAPLMLSETLTGLQCSNPRCSSKLVMRIRSICKDLNILSFGESTIEKFIEYYSVTNPLDIFELQEGMLIADGVSMDVSTKIIKQIKENDKFLLWEFVQVANIPGVRTSARNIFQGYNTLEEAYKDIEEGGVKFIADKLGITYEKDSEISIRAAKVYQALIENKADLMEGEKNVHIVKLDGKQELNVVCSDQVGGDFTKKPQFYAYVREHFGDKVHVNFLTSVNKNIDYLVWAGADGTSARYTSKVQKVEAWNKKGYNIPIVTGPQLIGILSNI